jgi:hypothetical protein
VTDVYLRPFTTVRDLDLHTLHHRFLPCKYAVNTTDSDKLGEYWMLNTPE